MLTLVSSKYCRTRFYTPAFRCDLYYLIVCKRALYIQMNESMKQKECFNHDELELLEDSVRYLIGCLDPEAAYLYADLAPLLAKIESMTNDDRREKRPTEDEIGGNV